MVVGFGVVVSAYARPLSKYIFPKRFVIPKSKLYQEGLCLHHTQRLLFSHYALTDKTRRNAMDRVFSFQPLMYNVLNTTPAGHDYCQNLLASARLFHFHKPDYKEINYEEFVKLKKTGLTVVDVRDKDEIIQSGTISGSINIPLQHISKAFGEKDYFKAKLGKKKPSENQMIMFLCKSGSRSRKAMETAQQLGYKHSFSFRGGWDKFSKESQ